MGFISDQLIKWHKTSGRHNLPWQNTDNPYLIWLSEIMLQQTQVSTVLTYFEKFIKRFPTIDALANAEEERVLELWSGLGYYARARNLHKTAIEISKNYDGKFPSSFDTLLTLPGIGRSTAGAISAFAFKEKKPILDGNVKRVFTRHFGIMEWAGKLSVEKKLWEIASDNLPKTNKYIQTYTQALMDLGATVCKRSQPLCNNCPLQSKCISFKKNLTKDEIRIFEAIAKKQLEQYNYEVSNPQAHISATAKFFIHYVTHPLLRLLSMSKNLKGQSDGFIKLSVYLKRRLSL